MLELKRYYADSGIADNTNAFMDEFEIGAGDPRNLSECVLFLLTKIFYIRVLCKTSPKSTKVPTAYQVHACTFVN